MASQHQLIDFYGKLGDLLPSDLMLSGLQVRVTKLSQVKDLVMKSQNQGVLDWVNVAQNDPSAEVLHVKAAGVLQAPAGTEFIVMLDRIDEINEELKSKREFAGFLIPPEKAVLRKGTNSLDLKEISWFVIPPG